MRIIHMSDLHLTSDKHPIWGVDTYEKFTKALNSIGSIPNIDCIVVSGDIADDGNLLTYQYADDMLNYQFYGVQEITITLRPSSTLLNHQKVSLRIL